MARTIAIANQKGGVGKTTTAVNLAASLAIAERRTLLIDADPQGNATSGVGIEKGEVDRSLYDVIINSTPMRDVVRPDPQLPFLHVIPATQDLIGAEIELVAIGERETILRRALADIQDDYDYILIDCPPSLGLVTLNVLTAADGVLIPIQCEYYALEGLSDLVNTIKRVRQHLNPVLEIEGLLRTMYDPRNTLSQHVSAQLQSHFGDKVYATVIPRNVRLAEAPSYGAPAVNFDGACKGSQAYVALAGEILARNGMTATA